MNGTNRRHARYGCSIALGMLVATGILPVTNAQTSSPRDSLVVTTDWLKQHAGDKDLVLLHVGEKEGLQWWPHPRRALSWTRMSLRRSVPRAASCSSYPRAKWCTSTSKHSASPIRRGSSCTPHRATCPPQRASFSPSMLWVLGIVCRSWMEACRPGSAAVMRLTKDVPAVTQGKLAPLTLQDRVVDAAFVQQHLKTSGYKIVDARAPVFYDGVQAGMGQASAKLKGHLPGATNIPFTSVTATDLTLKPADELAAIFKAAGVAQGDRVIAYCHIGRRQRLSCSPLVRSVSKSFCTTAPFRIGHDAGCRSKLPPRRRHHEHATFLRHAIRCRILSRTGLARRVLAHWTRARRFGCVRQRCDGPGDDLRAWRTCDQQLFRPVRGLNTASGAPWTAWMVVEVIGIAVGGAVSAALSGRLRIEVNGGPNVGRKSGLAAAAIGGALMGLGAVLARGCTSGQALSGGALLSVGSWTFMVTAFAAGFAAAPVRAKALAMTLSIQFGGQPLRRVRHRRSIRVRARTGWASATREN